MLMDSVCMGIQQCAECQLQKGDTIGRLQPLGGCLKPARLKQPPVLSAPTCAQVTIVSAVAPSKADSGTMVSAQPAPPSSRACTTSAVSGLAATWQQQQQQVQHHTHEQQSSNHSHK